MQDQFSIIAIILAVIAVIIGLNVRNRLKLKEKVRTSWGKQPRQPRFDKEKSLKKAWLTEKSFKNWDSEIDDITWYDLDMFEMFEAINSTYSSVGSEALYQQLRNFNFKQDQQLTELINFFEANPQTREKFQYYFAQLGKQDHNFSKQYLAEAHNQKPLGQLPFFIFLGLLPVFGLLILLLGQPLGLILTIVSVIFNTLYYTMKKANLETELESMRYLVHTIACGQQVSKQAFPLQPELQDALAPLKTIPRFGVSFRSKSGSEADMLFEYVNIMFMLPFISYHFVVTKLANHTKSAIRLWEILGKIEVACAILNFCLYMPLTCLPEIRSGGVISHNSYHPLLTEAVVNEVDWQQNTLVTGSNASGKSTYVKSVAINCILSQTIQTAVAERFSLQRGHVLTSMAVEDDLFEGDSYFVAEIKSIKRLLTQVAKKERCYCFIDEILKGTNTIERISASSSVVDWMAQFPSLAFVATHDIELTEILKNTCRNVHFSEQVKDGEGISFDYKLKQGPAKSRNAIALLRVMDYPQKIVENAQKNADYFDRHRQWQNY